MADQGLEFLFSFAVDRPDPGGRRLRPRGGRQPRRRRAARPARGHLMTHADPDSDFDPDPGGPMRIRLISSILLVVALAAALSACGSSSDTSGDKSTIRIAYADQIAGGIDPATFYSVEGDDIILGRLRDAADLQAGLDRARAEPRQVVGGEPGRQDLHVRAPGRGDVPRRNADGLGGGQGLVRARDRGQGRALLHARPGRHDRDPRSADRGHQPQAAGGGVPRLQRLDVRAEDRQPDGGQAEHRGR